MTDLDKLIEAVECGDDGGNTAAFINNRISSRYHDKGGYWPTNDVMKAHDGSLDAAKALHEALLDSGFHAEVWACCTRPQVKVVRMDDEYIGYDDTPARAWLLAILKAYRSQQ